MQFGLLLAQIMQTGSGYVRTPALGWTSAVADAWAALALLAIPLTLLPVMRRRRDLAINGALAAFALLALAGGLSRAFGAWHGALEPSWTGAMLKMATALAATATAVCVYRMLPRLFEAPGIAQLSQRNESLKNRLDEVARANAALHASEEMFRAFMDNSPMLAWVTDENGCYRYVSGPYRAKFSDLGLAADRRVAEFFSAEVAEKFAAEDRLVIQGGRPLEFRDHQPVEGREHQVFKFPLRDAEGRVLVGGLAFDVTEQLKARENLRQKSELFAAVSDAMRIYLDTGDWKTAHALLLRCALRQTQSECGFVGVMVENGRLRILAHEGVRWDEHFGREIYDEAMRNQAEHGYIEFARLEEPFGRAVAAGEVTVFNPPAEPAAGGAGPIRSFLGVPVFRERQVVGLIGVANRPGGYDTAAQSQLEAIVQQAGVLCDNYRRSLREVALEEQLRVSQKMEAVGLLAGGVAHDFNNLLQVIQGYTAMALEPAAAWPERRASLEQVRGAGERAAQLTQQLLAFGRQQTLQKGDVDLNKAIKDLLRMIRRVIGEQITVDFIPGHELGNVLADRAQVDQVLLNLCINARDALPNGGRITIETENVLVNGAFRESHPWAKPGRYVLVTVSDNGIGMDRETVSRIFEPFFTTKAKDKGTGLGLAVVYGVVKQHDGMVHVYSEPQKGTTFKIYLPMVERSASSVGPKHVPSQPRGTETVLLAEDEAMVRDLAQRILTRAGYRVLVAGDGFEACSVFALHQKDVALAILDVVMPQLGGPKAYERMVAQRPGLPVIYCSGYAGSALDGEAVNSADGKILAKPYGADELLAAVRGALDRR